VIIGLGTFTGLIVILLTAVNPVGTAIRFVLSSVAITGVVLAYLWLDRWEPEPPRLLVLAFVWGASVAVVVSVVLGLYVQSLFGRNAIESPGFVSVAIAAPLIEEAAKGLFLLLIMTGRRRNELNSMTDCLVYAGPPRRASPGLEDILYIASGESRIRSGRSQRRSSRFTLQFRRPAHPGVSSGCSTHPPQAGPYGRTVRHPRRHAKALFAAAHRAHHRGGTGTTY
jgi:hypothetical protein